jgi:hypothetical protein
VAVSQPSVLVVALKHVVSSPKELLNIMKMSKANFTFASIGAGSVSHLAMETLGAGSGADVVHVPYRGSGAVAEPARSIPLFGEFDVVVMGGGPAGIAAASAAARNGSSVLPMKRAYEWRVNVTQLKKPDGSATDGTDARSLSEGEIEGRRQIVDYMRFLREKVPGVENAYALDIAPQLGIRETRRLVGEYILTADDVLECADFDDSIGVNGWPLEKHVAGDVQWMWPPIPNCRGYNHCRIACCCRAGQARMAWKTCWSQGAALP